MKTFTGIAIEDKDIKDPDKIIEPRNLTHPDAQHLWWQAEMVIYKDQVFKHRFGYPGRIYTQEELEAHVRDGVLEKLKRPAEEDPWYIKLCKGYTWGMALVGSLYTALYALKWLHSLGL